MSHAPTLFDLHNPEPAEPRPTARATDPFTSHRAAALAALTAGTLRAKALEALVAAGADGLTDFELAVVCHSQQTSVGVRRKELVTMGYVEATGGTRPAPSGAAALVWRATAAGHEARP